MPSSIKLHQNACAGEQHRHTLQPRHALAQNQHAQGDVDQRGEKVAEAGLEYVVSLHRVDIHAPVQRDQHRTAKHPAQSPWMGQCIPDGRPATHQGDDQRKKHAGPDNPVNQHLVSGHALKQRKEQRKAAPHHVGADAVGDALTVLGKFCGHGVLCWVKCRGDKSTGQDHDIHHTKQDNGAIQPA